MKANNSDNPVTKCIPTVKLNTVMYCSRCGKILVKSTEQVCEQCNTPIDWSILETVPTSEDCEKMLKDFLDRRARENFYKER